MGANEKAAAAYHGAQDKPGESELVIDDQNAPSVAAGAASDSPYHRFWRTLLIPNQKVPPNLENRSQS